MNRIGTYGTYQQNFYNNNVRGKEEKDTKKTTGKTQKKDPVRLSEKAEQLLKQLQRKYGNMDFIVANYEDDDEASAYLSRGTKEYSVLIEPETLEKMAEDEKEKEKYMGIIDDATSKLSDMKEQLGNDKENVKSVGVSIDKDGNVSYFAELEKMGEKQRERIEKSKESKKAEKTKQEKAAQQEKTKKTRVQADSVEELLKKIKSVDWSKIKEEPTDPKESGSKFDFSI